MLFKLGETVMTRGIGEAMEHDNNFRGEVLKSFERYVSGDWGDLGDDDKKMNDEAVTNNDDRILAKYKTSTKPIYIITEWDRSYTTIMFCDEY